MAIPIEGSPSHLLKHDAYHDHTHRYQREVVTDSPDEATEFLNELGTTDEYIGNPGTEVMQETTGPIPSEQYDLSTTPVNLETTMLPNGIADASSSESSQTILIILGVSLGILVLVCFILICIFARMRRRGFCTMEGRNQAMCDDDCQGDEMSSQTTPKNSTASAKLPNSRSSDKLLE